jgi:exodeoxyribonuclease VII small subunit
METVMAKKAVEQSEEKGPGFEEAMERLEGLVNEMEGGSLGLEEMMARFEEGRKLILECTKKLNEVERRIEMLVTKGGETSAVPFEGEPGEGD